MKTVNKAYLLREENRYYSDPEEGEDFETRVTVRERAREKRLRQS